MKLDWSTGIYVRMHIAGITGLELSREAGISAVYLSEILHGKKLGAPSRPKIEAALKRLEKLKQNDSRQRRRRK